jgi:hypothetical protein
MSTDPTRPLPTDWQNPRHGAPVEYGPRRGHRFPVKTTIAIVVVILLLFAADRIARAVTENAMASQFKSSLNLSGKPSVDIEGFPFLTQLAGRDFHTVVVNGHNLTDGQLDLASIDVTAQNMHIHGFSSATVDSINGTATITLASIASAAGLPGGITFAPDGPNQVKMTVSVLGVAATAVAQVSLEGSNRIHVQVTNADGIPSSVLGNAADFTVTVPDLPSGISITGVTVTSGGVQISFSGTDTTFSSLP